MIWQMFKIGIFVSDLNIPIYEHSFFNYSVEDNKAIRCVASYGFC